MATPGRSAWSAGGLGAATAVTAVLPLSLVSAMVVQLGGELGFGASGLGAAVAIYWLANGATSVPLGRVADQLGAIWSLRLSLVIAAASALGVAVLAREWWQHAGFLVVAGCAHAVGHPAANRLLIHTVPPDRLGLAFGLKGAAAPMSSTLAGLSVPLIALTIGWRWAFVASAVLAGVVMFAVGRRPPAAQRITRLAASPRRLRDPSLVLVLAVSFGLATAASMVVSTFYVDAAVSIGTPVRLAGMVLAAGSVMAVLARLVTGMLCDRIQSGHLRICALLQAGGVVGVVLMISERPAVMAVGLIIALTGTWGFHGMFWYALVSHYREAPGRITGAIQPGAAISGTLAPLIFGFIAEASGYWLVWILAAAFGIIAAAANLAAARRLDRSPPA